jgi:tetratricopeptide (TPR) repeat protein
MNEEGMSGAERERLDPALKHLFDDPVIKVALDYGDRARLETLLRQHRKHSCDPDEIAVIDAALADRRLFMMPVTRPPAPGSRGGFSHILMGESDRDPEDHSYISTLWLALFGIPVSPVARYLVRREPDGSITYLGTQPLRGPILWWRRLPVVLLIVVAALFGYWTCDSIRRPNVHMISGLEQQVVVRFGDEEIDLSPGDRVERRFEAGKYRVQVLTTDGRLVMEETITVPLGSGAIVYNVLGAAPVSFERFVYAASPGPPLESRFCGGRTVVPAGDIDYVFEDPPEEDFEAREVRALYLSDDHWRVTHETLVSEGESVLARLLGERMARLDPENRAAVECAFFGLTGPGAADEARRLRDELLAIVPENIEVHFGYQGALRGLGLAKVLIREYSALRDENPGSPDRGYLLARTLEPDRARPLYEELVAEHPDHLGLKWGLSGLCFRTLEFERAVDLRRSFPDDWLRIVLWEQAMSLAALGRTDEAVRLVGDTLEGEDEFPEYHVTLYIRMLRHAGDPNGRERWEPYIDRTYRDTDLGPDARIAFAALAGAWEDVEGRLGEIRDAVIRRSVDVMSLARTDPDRAASILMTASKEEHDWIDDPTLLLLAGRLVESGEARAAEGVIAGVSRVDDAGRRELRSAILDGNRQAGIHILDIELQAAILFLHARSLPAGAERDALLKRARTCDVLRGPVTTAMETWPER